MNTQSHTTCHNPACRKAISRGDAHLRSISLEQVAFCSTACIDVYSQLDNETRRPVPAQRSATARPRHSLR
jgi:hypothetical protein